MGGWVVVVMVMVMWWVGSGWAAEVNVVGEGAVPEAGSPQQQAAAIKRETVEVARRIVEAYPQDALAHALLGSAHYNIGQSEMAIRELKRCLELNPERFEAYEILARIAYEKGDLEACVEWCQQGLKRNASAVDVQHQLGRALMDLGKPAEAMTNLFQVTRTPYADSETFYLLGQASLLAKEYAKAKSALSRAVALYPEHTQAFFGVYTVSVRMGEAEEAAKHLSRFRELESRDRKEVAEQRGQEDQATGIPVVKKTVARTLFGAAQVYGSHGEVGRARDMLRKAALYDPDNGVYRAAIETLYLKANAPEDGLKFFQLLAEEQADASMNHLFVGRFLSRMSKISEAEAAFLKARDLAPSRAEAVRSLADLYVRNGVKVAEAVVMARRAVELEPSGAHFHLLALACAQNQDRSGALEAVRHALERSPDNPKYQQLLQQLEKQP